jgi:Fe-S-cluster containining protein
VSFDIINQVQDKLLAMKTSDWLTQFYERFDEEVRLLLNKEPFWRICSSCPDGDCCRRIRVPVMSPEWENIVAYVKKNFSERNKNRYFKNVISQKAKCPFLFGNRCSVYSVRPWSCRIYPYVVSFYSTPLVIQSGNFIAPSCPTLAKPFGVIEGTISLCRAIPLEKDETGRLFKCQLERPRPLWMIDASDYFQEYDNNMPRNEDGKLDGWDMDDWVRFPLYLNYAGEITQTKFLELLGLD